MDTHSDETADAGILHLLETGILEIEGLLPWSSNYTFLLRVCSDEQEIQAVYKPRRGERPLWDFPTGTLCNREVAAYLISSALAWQLVPPTIMREGVHGIGSIQYFVDHDQQEHYFTFEGQFPEQVMQIALFDCVINNADRKSGHVLLAEDEHLWCIDHGVCFHSNYKLRTVIWEYAGIEIPKILLEELQQLQQKLAHSTSPLRQQLAPLLIESEMKAMTQRLNQLIRNGIFPLPTAGRHYPWPLV